MLHSVSGTGIDAARLTRDTPVHQLTLCFERRPAQGESSGSAVEGGARVPAGRGPEYWCISTTCREACWREIAWRWMSRWRRERRRRSQPPGRRGCTGIAPGRSTPSKRSTFSVGEKARLEYLPDPLIPYAGSRHTQRTEIRLAPGAALFWWETLAPGRQASGESFAFERLRIESEVRTAQAARCCGRIFLLEPAKRPLAVTARMREYSYVASLYVCQDGRPAAFWRALEDVLNAAATAPNATWRGDVGREHIGVRWSDGAGIEHVQPPHPRRR